MVNFEGLFKASLVKNIEKNIYLEKLGHFQIHHKNVSGHTLFLQNQRKATGPVLGRLRQIWSKKIKTELKFLEIVFPTLEFRRSDKSIFFKML